VADLFFFLPAADNARLPQDEKSPPTRRNSTMVCLFDVERTSLNWLMSPAPNTVTLPVSVVMSSVPFRQKLKVWGMVAPPAVQPEPRAEPLPPALVEPI